MKNFFDSKRPALWITATVAAAAVVPAVILLKKSRQPKLLFDQSYFVCEIVYQAPFYSFSCTPETAPLFRISGDYELYSKGDMPDQGDQASWVNLGPMLEFVLDEDHFDNLFFTGKEREIARIRRRNAKAWRLDISQDQKEVFYYLLRQKNGQIYLVYGYHADGQKSPETRSSIIRWLFKLSPSSSSDKSCRTIANP